MAKTNNRENRDSLQDRKSALESELDTIQKELGGSWEELKRQIRARSHPKNLIIRYPIFSVSAAFFIGMWLGRGKSSSYSNPVYNGNSMRALLANELKSIAVQKLARSAFEHAEDAVNEWRAQREAEEETE